MPDSGWIDVNPALARIFGYDSPAQMLSETSGRRANPLERALYRGAVSDDGVFHTFEAVGSRRRSPATLFAPRTLWQIARAA